MFGPVRYRDAVELNKLATKLIVPPIFVGDVSAETEVPIIHVGKHTIRPVEISIWVDTNLAANSSNYWEIGVETSPLVRQTAVRLHTPISTKTYGLSSRIWKLILSSGGTLSEQTLLVRMTPVGTPTALSGVSLSYSLEVR